MGVEKQDREWLDEMRFSFQGRYLDEDDHFPDKETPA